MTVEGARQITVTVEVPGLPTLVVSGEPWPPEPEIGIWGWVVDQLDWRGAECDLTPEQNVEALAHSRELEDAIIEELYARKAAAWGGAL